MRTSVIGAALTVFMCALVVGCVDCTLSAGETRVRGSGRVVEVERGISGVTGVELATFGSLKIEFGEKEKLVIEAEDNLIEFILTDIRGGILEIETQRRVSLKPQKKVRYFLTVKDLESIRISSSGDIFAPHVDAGEFEIRSSSSGDLVMKGIDAKSVAITMSSSGDVDLGAIDTRELDVGISSSGDLSIEGGEARLQNIHLSSSGDYIAGSVISRNAHVSISSSGDAHIHVDDSLNASLSSSGSLYYSGDPSLSVSTSSSGRVRRVGH
jgi:hypothetical protein